MTTILAIETSTPSGSVAIVQNKNLLAEKQLDPNQHHSATLLSGIDELCTETKTAIKNLDGIATSIGPGMFTGLRVGVSTAQGLAQANKIKLYAIPTLEAFAYSALPTMHLIFMTTDARRDEIYGALFKWAEKEEKMERLIPEKVLSPKAWIETLASYTKNEIIIAGTGYLAYKDMFSEELFTPMPENLMMPKASNVGILAQNYHNRGESITPDKIEPIYLRKL